jgi:hypothetical protein
MLRTSGVRVGGGTGDGRRVCVGVGGAGVEVVVGLDEGKAVGDGSTVLEGSIAAAIWDVATAGADSVAATVFGDGDRMDGVPQLARLDAASSSARNRCNR